MARCTLTVKSPFAICKKSELIGSIIGYRVNSNMFDWTKSKQKLRKEK